MAGLAFSIEVDWLVSRWIFRRLLEDVLEAVSQRADFEYWINVGIANDMLSFYFVEPDIRSDLMATIRTVVEAQIGDPGQLQLNAADQKIYVGALKELLATFNSFNGPTGAPFPSS